MIAKGDPKSIDRSFHMRHQGGLWVIVELEVPQDGGVVRVKKMGLPHAWLAQVMRLLQELPAE